MVGCSRGGRCEDSVNSVENAVAYMLAERGGALSKTNEVVHKHIDMGNRAGVKEEWRVEIRGWMAGREHERSERGTSTLPSGDQQINQGGDQQIPQREHDYSKCGTGTLPGGDQWITRGGDQQIPECVDGAMPILECVDGTLPMLECDVGTLPDWLGGRGPGIMDGSHGLHAMGQQRSILSSAIICEVSCGFRNSTKSGRRVGPPLGQGQGDSKEWSFIVI